MTGACGRDVDVDDSEFRPINFGKALFLLGLRLETFQLILVAVTPGFLKCLQVCKEFSLG